MKLNFIKNNIISILPVHLKSSKNFISCLLTALLFFIFCNDIYARPMISAISTNEIKIDSSFTGQKILLFGAKSEVGDLVIIIRGPEKDFIVNKKGKTLGVWHNAKRIKFNNVYSYYSFFTTNTDLKNSNLLKKLEIGEKNIKFQSNKPLKELEDAEIKFSMELIKDLSENSLYQKNSDEIQFLDETLFKVMLEFPKNIPKGEYLVEIYLIDDGNLSAFQAIPIYVNQVGFNATIKNMAHNQSFRYSIIAILLAVSAGFIANYIFNKLFK